MFGSATGMISILLSKSVAKISLCPPTMSYGYAFGKNVEKQEPISESDKKIIEKATEKEWEDVDKELEK